MLLLCLLLDLADELIDALLDQRQALGEDSACDPLLGLLRYVLDVEFLDDVVTDVCPLAHDVISFHGVPPLSFQY